MKSEQTPNEALNKPDVSGSGLKNKKVLNVIETSKNEVEKKWGFRLPLKLPETLYIRCNSKGIVNWEKAPVFHPEELIKRGNYNIIK